jgi:hypothetical protein
MSELKRSDDLEKLFKDLIDKSIENIEEERNLSLDRYREQNEQMTTAEDFVLQGKFAVDYLKLASDRSNSMINVAKMIKDIIYKDSNGGDGSGSSISGSGDAMKKEIFKYLNTGKSNSNNDKS